MPDLREKRVELTLQQLEELPTLPAVAVRVLQVTGDDSSSASDVVRLIAADPALTARILQLVRRADKGVRGDLTSIDRAVTLLGFDAVRNAVLAVSVFQALGAPATDAHARFDREAFWTHCLAVACCGELLAELAGPRGGVSPADAFLCGLLHDVGKLALDVALPKSYAKVVEAADLLRGNIADLERTVIGVDHQVAGKRLAERWQLPAAVRDVCWLHGQPPEALPAAVKAPLINLVTLADLLVRRQHLGYSGNYAFDVPIESLLSATGLTQRQVDQAMANLAQRIEPRSAALGLGSTTGEELYRVALDQANRELGHVSGQLAAKSRKLTQRTQFFDALRQFQAGVRSDASPQQVLAAIAATAAGVLGVERAAAFSVAPGQAFVEAVLADADGSGVETTLIEPSAAPVKSDDDTGVPPPEPGFPVYDKSTPPPDENGSPRSLSIAVPQSTSEENPVAAVGDDIEWVADALGPQLAGDRQFWVCLSADGGCVGGIVWGAAAGEIDRLAQQGQELSALAHGWALALRMAQVREESRSLAEGLADANRRLHAAHDAGVRSRSLTTVGELAAGAAHEMNNPLAVISGRSQLLASILSDEKHKAMARLIHEQADRLSDIITDMMAFAKPQPPKVGLCDLGSLINVATGRSKTLVDPTDRVIEVSVGDVPNVSVDAEQVADALAEVIANAVQATERNRGRVTVEAGHDPWSGRVVVTVADDGHGMDEAVLRRAFDPFYSAKSAGRRRGLGLAKAIRWVEAAGGTIKLESEVGAGTRATILLPAAAGGGVREDEPRRVEPRGSSLSGRTEGPLSRS